MSCSTEARRDGLSDAGNPKVIQLGLNISVAGNPASDIEIFVNDEKKTCDQLQSANISQIMPCTNLPCSQNLALKDVLKEETFSEQSSLDRPTDDMQYNLKQSCKTNNQGHSTDFSQEQQNLNSKVKYEKKDLAIIDQIKNAMGNFEKFSEHLREIPRLTARRMFTSTPYSHKNNCKSEGNFLCGRTSRALIPRHDFQDRKHLKKPKSKAGDIFLKPLPGEGYFKKRYVRRYCDVECYQRNTIMSDFPVYYDCGGDLKSQELKLENNKSDTLSPNSGECAIEEKAMHNASEAEVVDQQNTPLQSTKDIKIFQSGGIIIMQNFNDNIDVTERKNISEGMMLIENSNKIKELVGSRLQNSDDSQKLLLSSSSEDVRGSSGKFVQFNLSPSDNSRSKSYDSFLDIQRQDHPLLLKSETLSSKSDFLKAYDNASSVFPSQDLTSLSTQENDSVTSNLCGMSPTSSTSGKKLEWDSGADVGYLNFDLTKENISTIERLIIEGLADADISKKEIASDIKESQAIFHPSKFVPQSMASDVVLTEFKEGKGSESLRKSSNAISSESKPNHLKETSIQNQNFVYYDEKKPSYNGTTVNTVKLILGDNNGASKLSTRGKISNNETEISRSEEIIEPQKRTKSVLKTSKRNALKCPEDGNIKKLEDHPITFDKSIYVNTLFSESCSDIPLLNISKSDESGRSESSDRVKLDSRGSSRIKKLTKKRNSSQGVNVTAPLRDKIDTIIDIARYSSRCVGTAKNCSESVSLNGGEQSETCKDSQSPKTDQKCLDKEKSNFLENFKKIEQPSGSWEKSEAPNSILNGAKARPISASSDSAHTVQLNTESGNSFDTGESLNQIRNFLDQMIQTTELKYQSVGIQAFESSSDFTHDVSSQIEGASRSTPNKILTDEGGIDTKKEKNDFKLNKTCSKSIQVPRMNFSLPRHLTHPKHTTSLGEKNSKSSQYFGGPITSLPSYHSFSTKGVPAAKEKILNKLKSNCGNNCVRQENLKNIKKKLHSKRSTIENLIYLEPKSSLKTAEDCSDAVEKKSKNFKKCKNDLENKENLSVEGDDILTNNSMRDNPLSLKESVSANNGSQISDILFGSCDVQCSDDGRSAFLTNELLKQFGDSIDKNFIRQKYFQSQMSEFERRKMITRGTSMDRMQNLERKTQTGFSLKAGVSVGSQYSSSCIKETNENSYNSVSSDDAESACEDIKIRRTQPNEQEACEEDKSSQFKNQQQTKNILVSSKDSALNESSLTDSQSVHSSMPEVQQSSDPNSAIERAFSFEYLPRDEGLNYVYKISEEKSSFGIENKMGLMILNDSDILESENTVKMSEGGNTVVLENSDDAQRELDQIKNLNHNLTELEVVVSRLQEKEAVCQKITESVLLAVKKTNGSGDSMCAEDKDQLGPDTNGECCEKFEHLEENLETNGTKLERNNFTKNLNGMTTAIQSDTTESIFKKVYEERKLLEQQMNKEKEQQIKWIESEISHLNMIRSLLETQDGLETSYRRKRHRFLTEAHEQIFAGGTLKGNYLKKILSKTLTDINSSEDNLEKQSISTNVKSHENEGFKELAELPHLMPVRSQFSVTPSSCHVSKVQEVTMLPVGVQVTLRDAKSKRDSSLSERESNEIVSRTASCHCHDSCGSRTSSRACFVDDKFKFVDQGVQYSSTDCELFNNVTISNENKMRCSCECVRSNDGQYLRLKSFEKSMIEKGNNTKGYKFVSTKPVEIGSTTLNRSIYKSEVPLPSITNLHNSDTVSSVPTSRSNEIHLRESPDREQSGPSSEMSNSFEKCICRCHAQPLPRCESCHLLFTCKKCQCYRKIKCCLCKNSLPKSSMQKCVRVCPSYHCSAGDTASQQSKCSKVDNEMCTICSCHFKLRFNDRKSCKEQSSQTEEKESKRYVCNNQKEDAGLSRKSQHFTEKHRTAESRSLSFYVLPSENRSETEAKQPIEEEYPQEVPLKSKNVEVKNEVKQKTEVQEKCLCYFKASDVDELKQITQCQCKNQDPKRLSTDDHPRRYFLQVEETTEESSESCDNGNSLEVITIKVPIRKVFKERKCRNQSAQRNVKKLIDNRIVVSEENKHPENEEKEVNHCSNCDDAKEAILSNRSLSVPYETDHETYHSSRSATAQCRSYFFEQRINVPKSSHCSENCPGFQKISKMQEMKRATLPMGKKINPLEGQESNVNVSDKEECHCCGIHTKTNFSQRGKVQSECSSTSNFDCSCLGARNQTSENLPPNTTFPDDHISYPFNYHDEEVLSEPENRALPVQSENDLENQLRRTTKPKSEKKGRAYTGKNSTEKHKNESLLKSPKKSVRGQKLSQSRPRTRGKLIKNDELEKTTGKFDYYNFNKKEHLTKSELEREENKKQPARLTLQECLTVKRPDIYSRVECRRKIISEKTMDRVHRHNDRMESLTKHLPYCDFPKSNADLKLFTSSQMRKQTEKFYRNLPEITCKAAEEKKKMQFQTNKLMAEIFAKKLQVQTLKGRLNLSNNFAVMSAI